MFWRRKAKAPPAPPQIGCFGKLPATGDFVRLNAGGDEVGAFDRWLGASIDHARRSMGRRSSAVYPHSVGLFIFRGEGKGDEPPTRGLVGAWCASGDNAGRLYPMAVFGSYDYHQLVATGAALPIALWPLLTAAYELATNGRMMPVDLFLDRVSRVALPSLEDPEAAQARLPRLAHHPADEGALGDELRHRRRRASGSSRTSSPRSSPSAGRSSPRRASACASPSAPATRTPPRCGWT